MWAIKKLNFDCQVATENRLLQLNELEELRNKAYIVQGFTKTKQKGGMIKEF